MAGKLADKYAKLFRDFRSIETAMRDAPQDGQQTELRTAARALIRFEHENELPRLKSLVADHAAAVSAVDLANAKLLRLERSIAAQESYIRGRFATHNTTTDAIDLVGWRESARLGREAAQSLVLTAQALENELREFVKNRKGVSDCLEVEREHGWDAITAQSFDWLRREFPNTPAREAA